MIFDRWIRPIGLHARLLVLLPLLVMALPETVQAGFPATEVFLPAVGRATGNGIQIYSTVWATNLTQAAETFTFHFLKQGQSNATASSPIARSNASPAADLASTSFSDTLAPGQTKVYENVVETKLGLTNAIGAARVVSSGEILVAERIFNQPAGVDLGGTEGLFFAGVPRSFSISPGQSASIQGINQGGSENFRYNFVLVETGGGSPTVNVQVFDGAGALLGQKAYPLLPYDQIQPNVAEVVPGFASTNARITATVTGGTGSVLLAGAQVANESEDSSGFEMSFRDDILGSGGTAGVTSLNGLTGALTLKGGANVTISPSGSTITISASGGGGGGGLAFVTHDSTLQGDGSVSTPLGVAVPLTLSGTPSIHPTLSVTSIGGISAIDANSEFGNAVVGRSGGTGIGALSGISTASNGGQGVQGLSDNGTGVYGAGLVGVEGVGTVIGVKGNGTPGILGNGLTNADGVDGYSTSSGRSGVYGQNSVSGGYGVFGRSTHSGGIAVAGSGDNGGQAAHFYAGSVRIDNDLHVTGQIFAGTKDFEIDHPLDPAGKYLVHASIESSEMLNIYSGNVRLDARGEAVVKLPSWMEAENGDFRYQLTAIGGPARDLFVASEIARGEFRIAGGAPGMKVSWQVTGVRKDPWATANPLVVERPKSENEQGFFLHPELYGAPSERQLNWAWEPETMRRLEGTRTDSEGGSR